MLVEREGLRHVGQKQKGWGESRSVVFPPVKSVRTLIYWAVRPVTQSGSFILYSISYRRGMYVYINVYPLI